MPVLSAGPKIALRLEWLGLPLRQALDTARRLGVAGVGLDAAGDLSPLRLSATGRREVAGLVRGHDLRVAAVGCPLRHGLETAANQEARIDYLKACLTLSYEFGARLALVRPGPIPASADAPEAAPLREALAELARHADRVGCVLALDVGGQALALADYLAGFDTAGLGAVLDAAALVGVGEDPAQAARVLAGQIRYGFARDARRGTPSLPGRETELGAGDVDWPSLLAALDEVGYRAWLEIRRDQPAAGAEAAGAVAFLRRLGVQPDVVPQPRHHPGSRQERT